MPKKLKGEAKTVPLKERNINAAGTGKTDLTDIRL